VQVAKGMAPRTATSRILAWARLFRIPNVFTVFADVLMGHWFVTSGVPSWTILGLALVATPAMYLAGMVLNDYFDMEEDRRDRPFRPIPSGQIAPQTARFAGIVLMLTGLGAGLLCASFAGRFGQGGAGLAPLILCGLATLIVVYNAGAKRTWIGPWLMGGCRFLDVAWGMMTGVIACSVAMVEPDPRQSIFQSSWVALNELAVLDDAGWIAALGIGIYIAGVTYLARYETDATSTTRHQEKATATFFPVVIMGIGLALIACFPQFGAFGRGDRNLTTAYPMAWPLLVVAIGWSILRRAAQALTLRRAKIGSAPHSRSLSAADGGRRGEEHPSFALAVNSDGRGVSSPTASAAIQRAVKQAIVSLVVLDAAICMAVRAPFTYGLLILALLVPLLIVGRWVYST
jgi:UbiA prenyltransferase family